MPSKPLISSNGNFKEHPTLLLPDKSDTVATLDDLFNFYKGFNFFSDFCGGAGDGFSLYNSGTGSVAINIDTLVGNTAGIIDLQTGTTTTGSAGVSTISRPVLNSGKSLLQFESGFRLPVTLPDATENYQMQFGFDEWQSNVGNDGVLFRMELLGGVFTPYFSARKDSGTIFTVNATNLPTLINGNYYKVRIVIVGTTATFFMSPYGSSVWNNIGNITILVGAGDAMRGLVRILKTAGTTNRNLSVDYIRVNGLYSTPR